MSVAVKNPLCVGPYEGRVMEHRWGNRVCCDIAVKLFADPASAARGRIRNLSISGGFIETTLRIAPLSTLRLARTVGTESGAQMQVIRALVIRRDARGVGVEWFDGDTDSVMALFQEARGGLSRQPNNGEYRCGPSDGF